MNQSGQKWTKGDPSEPSITRWTQVDQSESRWTKVDASGKKWNHVDQIEPKLT